MTSFCQPIAQQFIEVAEIPQCLVIIQEIVSSYVTEVRGRGIFFFVLHELHLIVDVPVFFSFSGLAYDWLDTMKLTSL